MKDKIVNLLLSVFWSKATVGALISGIASILGFALKPETADTLACFLRATGCD